MTPWEPCHLPFQSVVNDLGSSRRDEEAGDDVERGSSSMREPFLDDEWMLLAALPGVMVQMAASADGVLVATEFDRIGSWVAEFAPRDALTRALLIEMLTASGEGGPNSVESIMATADSLQDYVARVLAVIQARLDDDERCCLLTALWVLMFEVAKDGGFTVDERAFLLDFVDAFDLDLDRGRQLLGLRATDL